jgi:hypothetical protein
VPRNILPWGLLAAALVVIVFVVRRRSGNGSGSVASPASSVGAPAPGSPDRPLDETELRESQIHAGPQRCEETAQHMNELEGNSRTDAKGMAVIGRCLRRGNRAWTKCVLASSTLWAAAACDRRLLAGDGGVR